MSEQQSITNTQLSPTWKWSSGKETPINELTLLETGKAAIHCLKRIRSYSDKVAYYEYKEKIAKTEVQASKAQSSMDYCNKMVLFFSNKLDQLSEHAVSTFNVEIPHDFDDLKELLNEIDKEKEKDEQPANIS